MGYSSGMLKHRVEILNKKDPSELAFGETNKYELEGCVWADITWKKGAKALREGSLDDFDTVMIRMRWNNIVTRESLLKHENTTYLIQSLHADRQDNTIQITATEMTTK